MLYKNGFLLSRIIKIPEIILTTELSLCYIVFLILFLFLNNTSDGG